jgi:hypothetical protein
MHKADDKPSEADAAREGMMKWVKSLAPFAIPLALSAALWTLPVPGEPTGEAMSPLMGRSIGLALLTLALLAIGYVARGVMLPTAPEREPPRPMALATHEFRRGFASSQGRAVPPRRSGPGVVVALPKRKPSSEPAARLAPDLGRETIERLTQRLQDRAGVLWSPRGQSRARS